MAEKQKISYELANERFYYDGLNVYWKTGRLAGKIAGWIAKSGDHPSGGGAKWYRRIRLIINRRRVHIRVHNLVWLLKTGEWPPSGYELDHYPDTDGLNNAWNNLRCVTENKNRSDGAKRGRDKRKNAILQ